MKDSNDDMYEKAHKIIEKWPDWKKEAYNRDFAVSKYSEKLKIIKPIDEIIYDLQLIETVTPDCVEGRNQSLSDEEIEARAEQAIDQAIDI